MTAPSPRQSPEDPKLVFTDLAGLPKREGPVRRAKRVQRWPIFLALVVILAVAAFCLALAGPAHAAEPVQAQPTQRAAGLLAWTAEGEKGATSPAWKTSKRADITASVRVGPCSDGEVFAVTLVRQGRLWPHVPHTVGTGRFPCSGDYSRVRWRAQPAASYFTVVQVVKRSDVAGSTRRVRTWSGLAFYDGRRAA